MKALHITCLGAMLFLASVAVDAQTVKVRGTISALQGSTMTMQSREGKDVRLSLSDATRVAYPKAISIADVKPGDYVGVAAVPDAEARLIAREVTLFPASMRGTGEGHYPWDSEPGSTMTNASVAKKVAGAKGNELSLAYPGGDRTVVVPAGVPIVTPVNADRSLLVPGKYALVFARPGADGTMAAISIQVEKDGIKPPQ